MKEHLKRHLLGVWLCALAYNPNLTMDYFEREKLTNEFFNQVTQPDTVLGFANIYEKKLLIIGLAAALSASNLPQAMQAHLLKIIKTAITSLQKLRAQEAKALKKAAKKEIKVSGNDEEEEDDEDDDEEDDGDDDDNDNDDHMEEKSEEGSGVESEQEELPMNADGAPDEEEEEKGDGNGGLGFVDSDESDDDLDEAVSATQSSCYA